MAKEFIWVEVDEDNIFQKYDYATGYVKSYAKNTLDDLADFGVRMLHVNVPQYTTYLLRHVNREAVRWLPGGIGGGGEYGTIVGIKAGTSKHPIYVEMGTGIYAIPARGYIQPKTKEYMSFFSNIYGRRINTKRVKGQRPQHYFYRTWEQLVVYARARLIAGKAIP